MMREELGLVYTYIYISSQCLLLHEYCENALLKLHQPMILQNHISHEFENIL